MPILACYFSLCRLHADRCTGVRRAGWKYPNSDYERLRFDIFCDLHQQGYVLATGLRSDGWASHISQTIVT